MLILDSTACSPGFSKILPRAYVLCAGRVRFVFALQKHPLIESNRIRMEAKWRMKAHPVGAWAFYFMAFQPFPLLPFAFWRWQWLHKIPKMLLCLKLNLPSYCLWGREFTAIGTLLPYSYHIHLEQDSSSQSCMIFPLPKIWPNYSLVEPTKKANVPTMPKSPCWSWTTSTHYPNCHQDRQKLIWFPLLPIHLYIIWTTWNNGS